MTGHVLSTSTVKAMFGDPHYKIVPGSRWVRLSRRWEKKNIVSVYIPELAGTPTYGGRSSGVIRCHAHLERIFKNAFAALGPARKYLKFYGGAFAPRLITGGRSLSRHTWGIAIDLNSNGVNGYGRTPEMRGSPYSMHEIAEVFSEYGFAWGGLWQRPDGMHLEYAAAEGDPKPQPITPHITVNGNLVDVSVTIESGTAYASAKELSAALSLPPFPWRDEMVPVAQFAKTYGFDVAWISRSKEIRITSIPTVVILEDKV